MEPIQRVFRTASAGRCRNEIRQSPGIRRIWPSVFLAFRYGDTEGLEANGHLTLPGQCLHHIQSPPPALLAARLFKLDSGTAILHTLLSKFSLSSPTIINYIYPDLGPLYAFVGAILIGAIIYTNIHRLQRCRRPPILLFLPPL